MNKLESYTNSCSTKNIHEESTPVARRYINSAVFVEMSISDIASFKRNDFRQSYTDETNPKFVKVKTCTCALGKDTCPSHTYTDRSSGDGYFMHEDKPSSKTSKHSSSAGSSETIIDKADVADGPREELKLSLSSLSSQTTICEMREKEKAIAFQKWLTDKLRQKKKYEEEQLYIQDMVIQEKERRSEMEKDNFMKWLSRKREEERRKKDQERKQHEEEDRLRREKMEKHALNKQDYQLWLRKKQEELQVKKINDHFFKLREAEEKQKRLDLNADAYETWLKSSKNKPKPVPSNRGLESLRTSVSVSFVNPTPWMPNIECAKPSTK